MERVDKTWGHEVWLVNNKDLNLCAKLLVFNPRAYCSYHYHKLKCEYFYVLHGQASILHSYSNDEHSAERSTLAQGEKPMYIPAGYRHRICNDGNEEMMLLEISTYHKNTDSYRVE